MAELNADFNAARKPAPDELFTAVRRGNVEVAVALIERGADVNARDNDGYTALILAVLLAYPSMARLLIDRGASLDEKDNGGRTALDWGKDAIDGPRSEITQMLREAKAAEQRKRLNALAKKRLKIRIAPRQK